MDQYENLHAYLKDASMARHQSTESTMGALEFSTHDGYIAFLRVQASAIDALERALAPYAADFRNAKIEWAHRLKSAVTDLRALGAEWQPIDAPALPSFQHALGAAYTMEGSRLGNAMLARQLNAANPDLAMQASNFLAYPAVSGFWRQFTDRLNAVGGNRSQVARYSRRLHPGFQYFSIQCRNRTNASQYGAGTNTIVTAQPTVDSIPKIDLNNCDREPIHLPGTIQSFGFLLAVTPDWIVQSVSANIHEWLGRAASEILGKLLDDILTAHGVHAIRNRLQALRGGDSVERVFCQHLLDSEDCFDLAIYLSNGLIVIEVEPSHSEPDLNSSALVRSMVTRLHAAESFIGFCREAARQIRILSGFDRVMVYRFDADHAGEVIAETVRGGVDSFLGLRYPASDIPVQARALYLRNWLRIISDVGADACAHCYQAESRASNLDLSLKRCSQRIANPYRISDKYGRRRFTFDFHRCARQSFGA